MTITYDGAACYDSSSRVILYDVRIDDAVVHCSFDTDALAFCVDDTGDPLDIFNSCRLLILAYTKCCLLRQGVQVDGQYTFGLEGDSGNSSSRGLTVLHVEPRYEDDAYIIAHRARQGIGASAGLSPLAATSDELDAGGRAARA